MRVKDIVPASKPRNFVAKNQKTAGAGAHKDKKKAEKQGDVKHKNKMYDEAVTEYGDTAKGQKMLTKVHKRAVDRMIKADDKRDAAGAKKNQQTANRAWDRFGEKEKYGESAEVMEYETHRWTDEHGNEWEIDDEGNKELISRGGGTSGRDGYTYRKRFKPSYNKPKGYYFYNVPAGKENDARAAGLRQSKSGKWFDTMTNFAAEKIFGKGRWWEPKN